MSIFFQIIRWSVSIFVLAIAAVLVVLFTKYPKIGPAEDITIRSSSELISRGEYLANHVAVCIDCHSTRDWSRFSGPITPGTEGMGGDVFGPDFGFPGTFYARNITPSRLDNWTDGEIYRTITTGVNQNGQPLFPVMPYLSYGKMDPQDVKSIIAYIRSLEPRSNDIPESKANFPMNFIMRTIPKTAEPKPRPIASDTLKYGEYLVTIGGCGECHTKQIKGKPVQGMFLAGGFEFKLPTGGIVRSANLTPDGDSGTGDWEVDDFLDRFDAFADGKTVDAVPGGFNTVMPWTMYAGMTEEDLTAIFKYLQSIPAIPNEVTIFSAE